MSDDSKRLKTVDPSGIAEERRRERVHQTTLIAQVLDGAVSSANFSHEAALEFWRRLIDSPTLQAILEALPRHLLNVLPWRENLQSLDERGVLSDVAVAVLAKDRIARLREAKKESDSRRHITQTFFAPPDRATWLGSTVNQWERIGYRAYQSACLSVGDRSFYVTTNQTGDFLAYETDGRNGVRLAGREDRDPEHTCLFAGVRTWRDALLLTRISTIADGTLVESLAFNGIFRLLGQGHTELPVRSNVDPVTTFLTDGSIVVSMVSGSYIVCLLLANDAERAQAARVSCPADYYLVRLFSSGSRLFALGRDGGNAGPVSHWFTFELTRH